MSLRRPWSPPPRPARDAAAAAPEREKGRPWGAEGAESPAVRHIRQQVFGALAVPGWPEDTLRTISALITADEHAPAAAKGALAALAEALRA